MAAMVINDLDYLAARLHARRSRMAEGERLDALCRLRAIPDLGRALRPESDFSTAAVFQRRLLDDLIQEFSFCLRHLDGAGREIIRWMQSQFQIENIKVLLRGFLKQTPFDSLQQHLVPLPPDLAIDAQALLDAQTPAAFARKLPAGRPREHLLAAAAAHRDRPDAFIFEAALDSGYFQELLARIERLADAEKELIAPLAWQEVETFHLLLAVRGKFNHGYSAESLAFLRVPGNGAADRRFKSMLAAADISATAKSGLGHVFDELPGASGTAENAAAMDSATLESLAARRFLRLANAAFRRSHLGLAAVVGYLEIRRVETANLITLSEGIRLGVAPETIHARFTLRAHPEVPHV